VAETVGRVDGEGTMAAGAMGSSVATSEVEAAVGRGFISTVMPLGAVWGLEVRV
jgi:hypothetical protein